MPVNSSRFSLEQLSELSGVAARTIRFYIQMELLPRPNGARRGAYYDERHLELLLRIRHLTEEGLSLEAVRRALSPEKSSSEDGSRAGAVSTRLHMTIAPGLEVVVDPLRAPLSKAALRRFAEGVEVAYISAEKKVSDKAQRNPS